MTGLTPTSSTSDSWTPTIASSSAEPSDLTSVRHTSYRRGLSVRATALTSDGMIACRIARSVWSGRISRKPQSLRSATGPSASLRGECSVRLASRLFELSFPCVLSRPLDFTDRYPIGDSQEYWIGELCRLLRQLESDSTVHERAELTLLQGGLRAS